jgi:sugar phosphate isomerase/epimerase
MNRDRICISTWSFHKLFEAGEMQLLDFPGMVVDRYGVHNIEVVAPHAASTVGPYFHEVRARLDRAGSRVVNVPIDYAELWEKPALSAADPLEREHAISLYCRWIDHAAAMEAHSVRCDPGTINLDDLSPTIASYRTLVAYARPKGIDVIVENHGSASRHPELLADVLTASGAGALPDFGNFPDQATRERGLRLLFPLARTTCHVKLDPARFDLGRSVEIARQAGFAGVYSIEAGGSGDPFAAVQEILDALLEQAA